MRLLAQGLAPIPPLEPALKPDLTTAADAWLALALLAVAVGFAVWVHFRAEP